MTSASPAPRPEPPAPASAELPKVSSSSPTNRHPAAAGEGTRGFRRRDRACTSRWCSPRRRAHRSVARVLAADAGRRRRAGGRDRAGGRPSRRSQVAERSAGVGAQGRRDPRGVVWYRRSIRRRCRRLRDQRAVDEAFRRSCAARPRLWKRSSDARVDRHHLLAETLVALARRYEDLLAGRFDAILDAWRRLAPRACGARVAWTTNAGTASGTTAGIDDSGALLVRIEDRVERIVSGEVVWL